MTTIRIEVDPEVAEAYQSANTSDRQKIQVLVNGLLKQFLQPRSLDALIEEMQAEAKAKGLTQEILDNILSGE